MSRNTHRQQRTHRELDEYEQRLHKGENAMSELRPTDADIAAARQWMLDERDESNVSTDDYLAGVIAERKRAAALVEWVGTMMAPELLAERICRGA